MSIIVLPIWTNQDGSDSSVWGYPAVPTRDAAWPWIEAGLQAARIARGVAVRVLIIDDLTWKTIMRITPGEPQ